MRDASPIVATASRPRVSDLVEPDQQHLPSALPGISDNISDNVDKHLETMHVSIILKALNVFTAKFPELRILQPSAFVREYRAERSIESRILLATVLAITKKQSSICGGEWLSGLKSSASYASYAWSALSNIILRPPNIQVVQALLILTLYEWGVRDFHKAWMHCGK